MLRKKAYIWLFVFAPFLLRGAEERFNLQRFIDLAVKNGQNIQIAQESVNGSEQKVMESKSLYFPQVSLSASYTRVSLVSAFDMFINGQMQHFVFMPPNNYSLRLSASEQVFNWGRTQQAVKMSRIGGDLARDAVALVRQMTAYQVVPVYYNLLFAREAMNVLDETKGLFNQRLKTLNERYEVGLASDFDLSLIQVHMSVIDSQKVDIQSSVRKMVLGYNRIANRPLEDGLVIDDRLEFSPQAIDAGQLIQEALANRVELKQFKDQENLARTQVAMARTGNKPTLVAAFNYELRNGFMPDVNQIRGNWTAVLSAACPVFDGFRNRSQVAQAQIGQRTVQRQLSDQETAVAAEIRQIVSDLQALEEKIAIEKTKLLHAQKALQIAEERYEKGLMSTTDLIDAQNNLANSRLNILQLTVNHVLNRYNLYRAVGRKIYQE
jgi:outer membrane protein